MKRTCGWMVSLSLAIAVSGCGVDEDSGSSKRPRGPGDDPRAPGAPGEGGDGIPQRVQDIVKALDTAMYRCPDRVWPGIAENYRTNSQILMVSMMDGKAYLWNDRSKASPYSIPVLTVHETAGLAPEWFGFFNVGEWNGVPTVGISLDLTKAFAEEAGPPDQWYDFATILALHEGFHFLSGQQEWEADEQGSRSSPHPEPFLPRYLRTSVLRSLREAVTAKDDAALAAAAHWQGRMRQEFGAEVNQIRDTDVFEGSAEYATVIMAGLAEVGCDATEAELEGVILEHIDEFVHVDQFILDAESYALGVVAGLLLRRAGIEGWESRVQAGEAPVDVLLDGVEAQEQADVPALMAKVDTAIGDNNAERAQKIDPMLERMASADFHRIPVPADWRAGAYGTTGFAMLIEQPGTPEVIIEYQALHVVPGSGAEIESIAQTVQADIPTPCEQGPEQEIVVLTVPASAVTAGSEADTFSASSDDVRFENVPATVVTDDAGLSWMCPPMTEQPTPASLTSAPAVSAQPHWRWRLRR